MKKVLFFVHNGFEILDLAGPMSVFSNANTFASNAYSLKTVSLTDEKVYPCDGPAICVDYPGGTFSDIDTFVVTGGSGMRMLDIDESDKDYLKSLVSNSKRIVSICTGAFVLAKLGLLDGKTITTHWKYEKELKTKFPNVQLESNSIFKASDKIYTSAGVTAGIDLALEFVRQDFGKAIATNVAKHLVVYLQRSGGQNQYALTSSIDKNVPEKFHSLIDWIKGNLSQTISVEILAEKLHMSCRTFQRKFTSNFKTTPLNFVLLLRLEKADSLLITTSLSLHDIAKKCGFSSVTSMSRAFKRHKEITPTQYRSRFSYEKN